MLLKAPLTLALSQRERGLTELIMRATPTCNFESNFDSEKHSDRLPSPSPTMGERGLTELIMRATPTCNFESNFDSEKHSDRLPSPSPTIGGEGTDRVDYASHTDL